MVPSILVALASNHFLICNKLHSFEFQRIFWAALSISQQQLLLQLSWTTQIRSHLAYKSIQFSKLAANYFAPFTLFHSHLFKKIIISGNCSIPWWFMPKDKRAYWQVDTENSQRQDCLSFSWSPLSTSQPDPSLSISSVTKRLALHSSRQNSTTIFHLEQGEL